MKTEYILIIFICAILSYADDWKLLGLKNESISAIVVNPSNPDIIYAGSSSSYSSGKIGGIFKSTDGGAVWDTLIRGVTVRDLDIHPKDSRVIYATLGINSLTTPGIIKSNDNGDNWFWADSGIIKSWEEGPTELVIDPKHPDTLYTGTSGPFGGRFYKSTDGGKHWVALGDTTLLRNGVTAIEIDPINSDIIYAGTSFSGNLLKSYDGGINWYITNLPEVGIVYDIIVDRMSSNSIYCGTWQYGFYYSTDLGESWINYNDGLPDTSTVSEIELSGNRIFIVSNWRDSGGIYVREIREEWYRLGIDGYRVNTISINDNVIYAGHSGIYIKDISTKINYNNIRSYKFLLCNYPNPFNNETTITYQLTSKSMIKIEIFDLLGRKQKTLLKEYKNPGRYKLKYIPDNLASGIYIVQLKTDKNIINRKIAYIR